MNKTPRSDNNIAFIDYTTCGEPLVYTYASFSRQLETELANSEKKVFAYKTALEQSESELIDARAEIERKDETIDACSRMLLARESLINKQSKLIEQMRFALEPMLSSGNNILSVEKARAALSVAERPTHESINK